MQRAVAFRSADNGFQIELWLRHRPGTWFATCSWPPAFAGAASGRSEAALWWRSGW